MKKNIILITLIVTALLVSEFVSAGVVIKDIHWVSETFPSGNGLGACVACHIVHKSPGIKFPGMGDLWTTPSRGIGDEGAAGNLCFTCHSANGYGSTVLIQASFSEKSIFPDDEIKSLSHGLRITSPYEKGTLGSGLPHTTDEGAYIDEGEKRKRIECTTCHNVHDNNAYKPFLRASIKELCIKCHDMDTTHMKAYQSELSRDEESGAVRVKMFNKGSAAYYYPISFEDPLGIIDGLIFDNTGRWNLGRHTVSDDFRYGVPGSGLDGGIGCITCHTVHSEQKDSDPNVPMDIIIAPKIIVAPKE